MSHTKGKLSVRGYYAANELGRAVFDCGCVPMEDEEIGANARRLVACWNRLTPSSTEDIEQGMDWITTYLKAEIDSLKVEIEQKGILLNGVKSILDRFSGENAALKAENRGMADLYQKKVDDCAEMEVRMYREIGALKAENERLWKELSTTGIAQECLNADAEEEV